MNAVQNFKESPQTLEWLWDAKGTQLQSWIGPSLDFGWEPYKKSWPHFMFWPTSFGIKNPATVWSRWAKYLSIYTGHNLVPYFQWWKWPILQETIDEVKHLPVWKTSEYLKDETRKSCSRHKIQTNDKSTYSQFLCLFSLAEMV